MATNLDNELNDALETVEAEMPAVAKAAPPPAPPRRAGRQGSVWLRVGRLAMAGWEPGEARDRVEEDLRAAFERGALSVLGLRELAAPNLGDQPSPSSRPRPQPGTKRSWIEIELLDDEGRRVATELVVTLSDGTKVRPAFNGFLRMDDIDPGLCDIEFPKIDGREWGPR